MLTAFEKNAAALRNRYPQWADKVLAWAHDKSEGHSCQGAYTDMQDAPKQDAPGLYLLYGIGSGEDLLALMASKPDSRMIVVEADPILFCKVLQGVNLTAAIQNPHVNFLVGRPLENFKMVFIDVIRYGQLNNFLPAATIKAASGFTEAHVAYYQQVTEAFTAAVSLYWSVVGNSVEDQRVGYENSFINLEKLDRCVGAPPYKDYFKDKIGIVVSSGPSLNFSLNALKALGDRAVVICADSALKTLLDQGIKPFGVATMERDEEIIKIFTSHQYPADVVYFTTPVIQEIIFDSYPGPIAFFEPYSHLFDALPPVMPSINSGCCCAHLAFQVLSYLGCRELVLLGQDLAFDPLTGDSYFSGGCEEKGAIEKSRQHLQLMGNSGALIETNYLWGGVFLDIFEGMIRETPLPVTNVIPKTHGLRIQGARQEAPEVFFERLAAEAPIVFPREMTEGRLWLQAQLPAFKAVLKQLKEKLHKETHTFYRGVRAMQNLTHAQAYFLALEHVRSAVSPDVLLILDEYWSPRARRFEAAAQSLWSDAEFCEHFGPYRQDWLMALSRLMAILGEPKCPLVQSGAIQHFSPP